MGWRGEVGLETAAAAEAEVAEQRQNDQHDDDDPDQVHEVLLSSPL
jgi:hypothetical protein